jgi:Tol biopolymer transport system component
VTRPVPAPRPNIRIARRRARRLAWTAIVAVLLVVAGVLAAIVFLLPKTPPPRASRLSRITSTGDVLTPVISPDGNFIAFVRRRPEVEDAVLVQDLRSGASLEVYRGGGIIAPAWSPDGSVLAVSTFSRQSGRGQLATVALLGGSPRVVAREPAGALAWSPDAKRILTCREGAELQMIDRETGARTLLPTPHRHAWIDGLDWSPQGNILLLARNEVGGNEIWILSSDGRRERRFDGIPEPLTAPPRWHSSGERFYYVAREDRGKGMAALTRIDLDPVSWERRGAPVRVGQVIFESLSISKDGARLVYPDFSRSYAVARVDLTTGETKSLRTEGERDWSGAPRVSPDGRHLLYRADRGKGDFATTGFVVSDRDGTNPHVVSSAPSMSVAVWSPEGNRIAGFVEDGTDRRLIIVNLESGDVKSLTGIRTGQSVEWAPGRQLLYQRADRRNYVLRDPDSGAERPLLAVEPAGVWQARYSPDGSRIAFARTMDPAAGMSVAVANVADGAVREIYDGRAAPIGWSPDGEKVFLIRENPASLAAGARLAEIVACPAAGGEVRVLLTLPTVEFWSWMEVAPDGKELVYTQSTPQSDAWLLEDFDPDLPPIAP